MEIQRDTYRDGTLLGRLELGRIHPKVTDLPVADLSAGRPASVLGLGLSAPRSRGPVGGQARREPASQSSGLPCHTAPPGTRSVKRAHVRGSAVVPNLRHGTERCCRSGRGLSADSVAPRGQTAGRLNKDTKLLSTKGE